MPAISISWPRTAKGIITPNGLLYGTGGWLVHRIFYNIYFEKVNLQMILMRKK
jgi:hypothetical protein